MIIDKIKLYLILSIYKIVLKQFVTLTSAGNRFQLSSVAFGDSEDKRDLIETNIFFISRKYTKKTAQYIFYTQIEKNI